MNRMCITITIIFDITVYCSGKHSGIDQFHLGTLELVL